MKKNVWKILIVALLAVLLMGLTASALAENKCAFSKNSGKKVIDGEGSGTYTINLLTDAASLVIKAQVASIEEGGDDCDVAIKPQIPTSKIGSGSVDRKYLDEVGTVTWTLTNVRAGSYDVKVNSYDETDKVVWKITVTGKYKIKLTPNKVYMVKGKTVTLTRDFGYEFRNTIKQSNWSVGNKAIASVTKTLNGAKVKGLKAGDTNVYLKVDGQTVKVPVKVYAMDKETATVYTDHTLKLKVLNIPESTSVTWSSNKTAFATVNSVGTVVGVKKTATDTNEYVTISARFADPKGNTQTVTAKIKVKQWPFPMTLYVKTGNSGGLYLRAKASRSSSSLGLYNNGTKVTAIGESGDWYKVKVGTKTGYMMKQYLSKTK